jgi:hypothetical protein
MWSWLGRKAPFTRNPTGMRPISVSIASMDVFGVVLCFYGLYLVGRIIPLIRQRFRTERSRQMIMTRPRTVARLEENRRLVKRVVERKNQDPVIYWEARLREPFTYFQRGQLRQRSTIAPGTMRLNRKQALALEAFLQNRNALLAYLEPKGEASAYLTPGPPLLSWRSMITGLAWCSFRCCWPFCFPCQSSPWFVPYFPLPCLRPGWGRITSRKSIPISCPPHPLGR